MSSDRDRLRRADELFDLALDLAPAARSAFVEARAAGDAALRDLVLRLLEHADDPDPALAAGGAIAGGLADAGDAAVAGERIGRYRIVRELGRGGMAVVFLAERDDGGFVQDVALKLVQDRFPAPSAVARFERERQILADARHPNLAALLDGGETEDGRPYLVMELVDGRPIDEHCDERRLTVRERLRLFLQVARAVEHAHRNLVVHRDIKPSNILVTPQGVVKLLDFGIAKLLDEAADGADLTRTHDRPMTPAFASPEQIAGGTVTAASDIYQLGVLLYLLLTGRWPYRGGATSGASAMMAILEQPARRPSSVVSRGRPEKTATTATVGADAADPERLAAARGASPARLRHELAGDLDAILLTTLRKEPERRYASVTRLIEDLEAVLDHRPVSARRDSLGYRAGRFLRRHAAASVLGAASLLTIAFLTGFHLVEVGRERDRARAEAASATEVARFLRSLFEVASPTRSRGEQVTARELLDRGAERIERDLAGEPGLRADLESVIADVYRDLGLYDEALALAEQAVATRRDHPGAGKLDLADALMTLGRVHEKLRDGSAGKRVVEEALELRRRALGPDHPDVARAEDLLGLLCNVDGEYERALELERHAAAVLERELGPVHADVGEALAHVANTLSDLRRYDEALRSFRRAISILERARGADHPLTAAVTFNMANSARNVGDTEAAEQLYRASLERIEAVYGADHPNVGVVMNNFANLLRELGRLDEAEALHLRTLELWSASHGPDHVQVTWSLNNLGLIERDRGDHEAARAYFERTLEILEARYPADHAELATPLLNLGAELIDLGRHREAVPFVERATAIREQIYGPDHSYLSGPSCRRAEIHLALGELAPAEARFRRAAELARAQGDERDAEATRARVGLARVAAAHGRIEEARAILERERELARPEDRRSVEAALAELGSAHRAAASGKGPIETEGRGTL